MGYSLRLIVNRHCNFKCVFCYQEGTAYPKTRSLNYRDFIGLAKEFAAIRPLTKIRVTGGEPLVYHDLLVLLKGLRREFPSLDIGFTTNASIPDELMKVADAFSDDPLHINVSLPSLQTDRFEEITRSSRYLEVMSSIEYLVAHGFASCVSINFVFMSGMNDSELSAIVGFARANSLRLKVISLTINEFNRDKIHSFGIEASEEDLIRDKIADLGYVQTELGQTFIKGEHHIEVVNCFAQQPIPYFKRFRTLRVYYDGRIGINGDFDGFIRPIDLKNPRSTFTEILDRIEPLVLV